MKSIGFAVALMACHANAQPGRQDELSQWWGKTQEALSAAIQ